ncbi:hypothetical protein KM92DES2_20525 [uncultured Desulfovibrio sp.]|uniref:Uncharacterized protein n=1 Tax=uncultured Desulfovibrio sp. TaxID=167968 RepID=A0A212KLA4_9BACT|nr:hypothetical protein KM92DES2_20525 [uncultured Desulfovibrio sp.]
MTGKGPCLVPCSLRAIKDKRQQCSGRLKKPAEFVVTGIGREVVVPYNSCNMQRFAPAMARNSDFWIEPALHKLYSIPWDTLRFISKKGRRNPRPTNLADSLSFPMPRT